MIKKQTVPAHSVPYGLLYFVRQSNAKALYARAFYAEASHRHFSSGWVPIVST